MISSVSIASLLLASTAFASPLVKKDIVTPDDTCAKIYHTCVSEASPDVNDAWSHKSCVLAATCFGGHRPVDDMLASVYSDKGGTGTAPTSRTITRLGQDLFNSISTDGNTITQQNWIDAYYGELSSVGGPFPPNSNQVINYWQRIPSWTGFCPNQGVPYMNFADYFEYSATVQGGPGQNCARDDTSLPKISNDATCQRMFEACHAETNNAVTDAWSHKSCLFAATCFGGSRPVNGLLASIYSIKAGNSEGAPTDKTEPRLPFSLFKSMSTDGGHTFTQQNFIDNYYGQLSSFGGPYPPNSKLVISYFQRISAWAGFCPNSGIPYKNTADYFEYSAEAQGAGYPSNC